MPVLTDLGSAPQGYSVVPEADVRVKPGAESGNGELRDTGRACARSASADLGDGRHPTEPDGSSAVVCHICDRIYDTLRRTMTSLPERIMEHAEALPEATPICPAALLHLGNRPAVNQALSRLARSGRLMRICHGVYMRPVHTRFGRCAPSVQRALEALSGLWGETIVPNGGGAANWLGLTTQNPVRSVYLTSGRDRRLYFGKHPVDLRHAPRWHGSAQRKSRPAWTPFCADSRGRISTNSRPRAPSCRGGWRSRWARAWPA